VKTCYVLRGLPGSGKTTWAETKADEFKRQGHTVSILSADIWRQNSDGVLVYDRTKLKSGHMNCLSHFIETVRMGAIPIVIVDNCNIWTWEYTHYLRIAEVYGYELAIMELTPPVKTCLERNIHHYPENEVRRLEATWDGVPLCFSQCVYPVDVPTEVSDGVVV